MASPHDEYLGVVSGGLPDTPINAASAVLLCVDLQYADGSPDFGIGRRISSRLPDQGKYYFDRIENTVLPNVARLQRSCREAGIQIIHVRIRNQDDECADASWRFRQFGMLVPPRSREADFLEGVEPIPGEIVVDKTSSSPFNSTAIDDHLHEQSVQTLIVAGVVTNHCVENTVRDAGDRDYRVHLVDDGCAAYSHSEHEDSLRDLHRTMAVVRSTSDIIREIQGCGRAV